jgi:hypothetical protein
MAVVDFNSARWKVEHTTGYSQDKLQTIVAMHALCLADFVAADISNDKVKLIRVGARLAHVHNKWRNTLVNAIGGCSDPV